MKKKNGGEQRRQTTPNINQGKGATLVLGTVKLLHRRKENGDRLGIKDFNTIHVYNMVKAHAGILGNECADASAKCSAEN